MQGDLTTLANLKAYLGGSGTGQDALLSRLITAVSKTVLNYTNRQTFAVQSYTEVYDGNGHDFMLLRQWPVITVAKVEFGGTAYTVAADTTTWPPTRGFAVEDGTSSASGAQQRLMLFGMCFPRQRQGVRVTYSAGYLVIGEEATVPASTPYTVATQTVWLADSGVTYANGTALAKVTGTPAAGQYAVAAGVYTFASADHGAGVLISYSGVPQDVEQAVIEAIAEQYKRKDRIGVMSQSIGGQETISYSQKDMGEAIKLALIPFSRVTPT